MDGDEQQSLQRFQHPEQHTEVQREVCANHQGFDQRALRLLRGEELDAAAEHADRLQQRERGNIRAAWYFTMKRANPRLSRACSSSKASSGMSTSGSRSIWFGWPWCSLCLSIHHWRLMPSNRLPKTRVSQSFFQELRKENCRCPKSWARRLSWTKTNAR